MPALQATLLELKICHQVSILVISIYLLTSRSTYIDNYHQGMNILVV